MIHSSQIDKKAKHEVDLGQAEDMKSEGFMRRRPGRFQNRPNMTLISLVILGLYSLKTIMNTSTLLSKVVTSLETEILPTASSEDTSTTHWWEPFIDEISVIYKPSNQHQWCDTTSVSSPPLKAQQRKLKEKRPGDSDILSGLFLVKVPKTGSSTVAGVSIQIAESIGLKKGLSEPCPSHVHHGKAYTKRKDPSFLWTAVRRPDKRSISQYFFIFLTRRKMEYNSKKLIELLESLKSFQYNYISKGIDLSPMKLKNRDQVPEGKLLELNKVSSLFQPYDFIAVTERMDESLVVLKLLYGFPDESIIVSSAKVSGGFDDGLQTGMCQKIIKSYTTEDVDEYLADKFQEDNLDYLLHAAANKSLDKTIDFLGRDRVEKELERHIKLREQAEEFCVESIAPPCVEDNVPVNPKAKESCYYGDLGCGHECIMNVIRNGTVTA